MLLTLIVTAIAAPQYDYIVIRTPKPTTSNDDNDYNDESNENHKEDLEKRVKRQLDNYNWGIPTESPDSAGNPRKKIDVGPSRPQKLSYWILLSFS